MKIFVRALRPHFVAAVTLCAAACAAAPTQEPAAPPTPSTVAVTPAAPEPSTEPASEPASSPTDAPTEPTAPTASSEICQLPEVTGPCKASFRRFRFDASKGACVQFIYGGCEGNANNFESKAACEAACK